MAVQQKIEKFETLDCNTQQLLKAALEARKQAYCPYSNFQVGAALLCEDGTVVTGCNVENVSFTVGYCAERVAYVKAVSEGKKKFKSLAVIAFQEASFTTPCGACRQFISEFGDLPIYCGKPDLDSVLVTSAEEILPFSFAGAFK